MRRGESPERRCGTVLRHFDLVYPVGNEVHELPQPPERLPMSGRIDLMRSAHFGCGGDVQKRAPGVFSCEDAECLNCGMTGAIRSVLYQDGDLCFDEHGRLYVEFDHEPELDSELD